MVLGQWMLKAHDWWQKLQLLASFVTFGDNSKGKIMGVNFINQNRASMKSVFFSVQDLKHNLMSMSQLYDSGI
jgi:hypothetical protein